MERIVAEFLLARYGICASAVSRMTTGVGGDTFRVQAKQGAFVFKIVRADAINHPERESALCSYLIQRGIPASEFIPDNNGQLTTHWSDGRVCHLQRLIPGKAYAMNTAPDWFMEESPRLLGRIHIALMEHEPLPEGIGTGFFAHMTPENALHSYRSSLDFARERGEEAVCEALAHRIRLAEKHRSWRIDPALLTRVNTHGDYTVNQIICADGCIHGVIDWTSACTHPAVWELVRSYFYAAPECRDGGFDERRLQAYIRRYDAVMPLSPADHAHMMDVYLYQLLVCDYYSQYLHAGPHEAAEFLQQANFATAVLRHALT